MILKITPCYFDGTININDIDLKNISLDEKSHDSAKPLRIILNKADGYAKKSDKTNIYCYFILKTLKEHLRELNIFFIKKKYFVSHKYLKAKLIRVMVFL